MALAACGLPPQDGAGGSGRGHSPGTARAASPEAEPSAEPHPKQAGPAGQGGSGRRGGEVAVAGVRAAAHAL